MQFTKGWPTMPVYSWKKAATVPAPISGEIDSVAAAQTLEERRVFHTTVHGLLAPPVECGAELTAKVA